jgi:predicted metal-dependent hydrolase
MFAREIFREDKTATTPGSSVLAEVQMPFQLAADQSPMFIIDYVIVHELAHLIEANHTPTFWNILRAQAPTMEKAKSWLKENGQLLEQEI